MGQSRLVAIRADSCQETQLEFQCAGVVQVVMEVLWSGYNEDSNCTSSLSVILEKSAVMSLGVVVCRGTSAVRVGMVTHVTDSLLMSDCCSQFGSHIMPTENAIANTTPVSVSGTLQFEIFTSWSLSRCKCLSKWCKKGWSDMFFQSLQHEVKAFFAKVPIEKGPKTGPIFRSRIEPAKRVDPLWVHSFCGLHFWPRRWSLFLGAVASCC